MYNCHKWCLRHFTALSLALLPFYRNDRKTFLKVLYDIVRGVKTDLRCLQLGFPLKSICCDSYVNVHSHEPSQQPTKRVTHISINRFISPLSNSCL